MVSITGSRGGYVLPTDVLAQGRREKILARGENEHGKTGSGEKIICGSDIISFFIEISIPRPSAPLSSGLGLPVVNILLCPKNWMNKFSFFLCDKNLNVFSFYVLG